MCRGRRARILLHLYLQLEGTVLRGSRAGRRFGCRNHPSYVHVIQLEGTVLRGSRAGRRFGCRNHPSCVHA
jgi:hypothetical protein